MCRDIDLNALEGVIFDHVRGLDPYILNRLTVLFIISFSILLNVKKNTLTGNPENLSICVAWWMAPIGRDKNVSRSLIDLEMVAT